MHPAHLPAPRRSASLFIRLSAAFVLLTAAAVLYGWFTQNAALVQLRPQYAAVKFNSALGLLLTALALAAAEGNRRTVAALLAALAGALPLATLAEYAFDVNLGIDDLFAAPFIDAHVRYVGRMAPNTAIALALTDITILFYALAGRLRAWGEMLVALGGSLVSSLGLVPLIGYAGGIAAAHSWGQYTGMALPTALCLLLLGGSLIACAWKHAASLPAWLAVPVGIGFLITAISMWQTVKGYEDNHFEQSLQQEAEYVANRGTDRLTAFYSAIDRIAARWTVAGGTPHGQWEADVGHYLQAYPFLKAAEWVDADSVLQWAAPLQGNDQLIGARLNSEGTRAATAQLARSTRAPQVTEAVALAQGGTGFLYMNPLFVGDRFDGHLVAAYTLDEVFGKILRRDKSGPFYLTVTDGDQTVFTNMPAGYESRERWRKTALMKNHDRSWLVTVNPAPDMLARKNSPLPMLILITGALTSVFAAFSVMLAFRARRAAALVRANEERLREIIAINSTAGAPDFDLQAFMDLVAARMLAITPTNGVVIELADRDEMIYRAASGSLDVFKGMRIKRAGSLSGLCVEKNEVLISHDTATDPRVNAEACRKVNALAMAVAPLVQRGAAVGALKLVSGTVDAFGVEDIRTLQLMAGLLGGVLGQELEMERRRQLEQRLLHLAQYDNLTCLPNRALFNDRLAQALINNRRNGKYLAVIYMDIDHFKSINDKYGHAEGDALLKSFGARIGALMRQGDTLARLGGDEFVVIAENLRSAEDAELVAAKIVEAMQQDFELPTVTLKIGASLGVAVTASPDIDAEAMLARADEALYEVKRAGRNRFRILEVPSGQAGFLADAPRAATMMSAANGGNGAQRRI